MESLAALLVALLVFSGVLDQKRTYPASGLAPLDAPVVRPFAWLAWAGVTLAALLTGLGLFLIATGHGA